jgi:hypothetical protein
MAIPKKRETSGIFTLIVPGRVWVDFDERLKKRPPVCGTTAAQAKTAHRSERRIVIEPED